MTVLCSEDFIDWYFELEGGKYQGESDPPTSEQIQSVRSQIVQAVQREFPDAETEWYYDCDMVTRMAELGYFQVVTCPKRVYQRMVA